MHVTFWRQKLIFDRITAFLTSDDFEVKLQYEVVMLYNQLLPEFSSNQFDMLQAYCRCEKMIFGKIMAFLT